MAASPRLKLSQAKSAPSVRLKTQASASAPSLNSKVESLVSGPHLNRSYDFFKLLAEKGAAKPVKLRLAETCWRDESGCCFLFTDDAGNVRTEVGSGAVHAFLIQASVKNRQIRNSNPLGIKFPKFLSFRSNVVDTVFRHKAGIKEALDRPPVLVQRYVVPANFQALVKVIHWRRTKRTKVYSVSARQSMKVRRDTLEPHTANPTLSHDPSLFTAFTVSLHNLWSASVTKDSVLPDELADIIETIRRCVLKPVLLPGEVAEEIAMSAMRGLDGKLYVLPLLRARVSQAEVSEEKPKVPRTAPSLHLADVLQDERSLDRLNCRPMPFISLTDLQSASRQIYLKQVPPPVPISHCISERYFDSGLDTIAEKLDKLKRDGQHLKCEFGVVKKVDYSCYPHSFLTNVINRLYFSVMRDQRLVKFYPTDKNLAMSRLEASVRTTIERGTSRYLRLRMHKIHENMGITDRDFEMYLRYFADAMRAEEATDADIAETMEMLTDFKSDVVIPKKEESESLEGF